MCSTGLAASVVLAGFVSFYASANPDGLEKVAQDKGIDGQAEGARAADSPLADYGVKGIADARLSGGLAGLIGVGVDRSSRAAGCSGRCAGAVPPTRASPPLQESV